MQESYLKHLKLPIQFIGLWPAQIPYKRALETVRLIKISFSSLAMPIQKKNTDSHIHNKLNIINFQQYLSNLQYLKNSDVNIHFLSSE